MKNENDPRKWRGGAPVPSYAIILGILAIAALIVGVQYGRAKQNPVSSGAPTTSASSAH